MTLLDSLLDAIVRLDGDSLVMHVGEKPYVVTTSRSMNSFRGPLSWGQVELSSRALTADAVLGMLGQILPVEQLHVLEDVGAIEHELGSGAEGVPSFILTAARGGDDIWVEVRRKPVVVEEPVAAEAAPDEPAEIVVPHSEEETVAEAPASASVEERVGTEAVSEEAAVEEPAVAREATEVEQPAQVEADVEFFLDEAPIEEPTAVAAIIEEPTIGLIEENPEEPEFELTFSETSNDEIVFADSPAEEAAIAEGRVFDIMAESPPAEAVVEQPEAIASEPAVAAESPPAVVEAAAAVAPATPPVVAAVASDVRPVERAAEKPHEPMPDLPWVMEVPDDLVYADLPEDLEWTPAETLVEGRRATDRPTAEPAPRIAQPQPVASGTLAEPEPVVAIHEELPEEIYAADEAHEVPVVVPIAKPALKLRSSPPPAAVEVPSASTEASLVGVLKAAAARGASTVYAVADSRPMIRIDGKIAVLGIEAAVTGAEVDRFTFEFAPRDKVAEVTSEWTCSIKGIGRVRCVTFRDDSGTGLIFHLPSGSTTTAGELGLSPRVQALCEEADGLVVIAGPRDSGKSTILDAFVDLINRTRNDHVITIESQIRTTHEKRHSFISQRRAEPDGGAIAAAARAALREGPDVLVIEDLRAPEALSVALDAARAGRLVFGGIAAPTASAAVGRLVGAFPNDRRPQVRALLAGSLRAVVAQALVRKPNGGRVGARELLLNSPAVEELILAGAIPQLSLAIEGGRRLGMVTMNDALGALVREGVVEIAEAARCAPDRGSLIAALERDGIDVSDVERRA